MAKYTQISTNIHRPLGEEYEGKAGVSQRVRLLSATAAVKANDVQDESNFVTLTQKSTGGFRQKLKH